MFCLPGSYILLLNSDAEMVLFLDYCKPFTKQSSIFEFSFICDDIFFGVSPAKFLVFVDILDMQAMLIVDVFLRYRFLYFSIDLANNGVEVIFILELQLLVVTTALIRGSTLEDLGETEEHLGLAPRFFREEISKIINHELQIDLIFLIIPLPNGDFILAHLEPHLLNLMIFGLKALLIRFHPVFSFFFQSSSFLGLSHHLPHSQHAKIHPLNSQCLIY